MDWEDALRTVVMMAERHDSSAESVGRVYDEFTDLLAEALGGNVHLGYWDDDPDVPVSVASNRLTDLVAARLGASPGERVLDIGCGNGKPGLRIADRLGVHVTGITVSVRELEQAEASVRQHSAEDKAVFMYADAMNLPFDDASFDGVFAIESLLHMPSRRLVLGEAARVVRPGGRFAVSDMFLREPVHGEVKVMVDQIMEMFEIVSVATADDYQEDFRATGWQIVDLQDIGECVKPAYRHISTAMRSFAGTSDGETAEQLTAAADLIDALTLRPETSYAMVTAERL
jgi:N-methyltransferase StaMA